MRRITRRLVIALAIIALVLPTVGPVGYAQEPATWVHGYPEQATTNCVWYVAQWSDRTYTNSPVSCNPGFVAQSDGLTATRSYPEVGAEGCTWQVTHWENGTYSQVPFQCPVGATAQRTGTYMPAGEKQTAVAPLPTPAPVAERPPYSAVSLTWGPNCSITRMIVYLQDSAGRFVNGIVFRLETADGTWGANSNPTGSEGYGPGTTDFTQPGLPEDQTWNLFVVDGAGQKVSAPFQFTTQSSSTDCNWDGSGHQVAWITFQQNTPQQGQAAPGASPADEGLPFKFAGMDWDQPNCGMTRILLFARDQSGNPLDGVLFRVESGGWAADSYPTGQDDLPDGFTDFFLRDAAFANTWYVWAIDDTGARISPVVQVSTDDVYCEPGGSGHQIARLAFTRR